MKKNNKLGSFFRIHFDGGTNIFENLSSSSIRLLTLIWEDCGFHDDKNTYPGSLIRITKPIKQRWAVVLRVEGRSVDNMLLTLRKYGMLKRMESTIYQLNPEIFFKGKSHDRILIMIREGEYFPGM